MAEDPFASPVTVDVEGLGGVRYVLLPSARAVGYREAERKAVVLVRRIAPSARARVTRNAILQGAAFAVIVGGHAWAGCGGALAGLGGLLVAATFAALVLRPVYEEEELSLDGTSVHRRGVPLGKVARIEALPGRSAILVETDQDQQHTVLLASEDDARRLAEALRARIAA